MTRAGLAICPAAVILALDSSSVVLLLAVTPPLAAVAGAMWARRDPPRALAGALLLAAWAPEAVWLATGFLPVGDPTILLGVALWAAGAAIVGAVLLGLVALARRPSDV